MKTCYSCKVSLPLELFSKSKRNADDLQGECKSCHKAYAREHYQANKEKHNANTKAWRHAHPESDRKWSRERQSKRRKENAHLVNAATAARKSYIKQATPAWANKFFITEAYHLAKLREKMLGGKWQVDHIIPLRGKIVSGLHVEHNLQVIPAQLNLTKHARFTV
jgi:hypothetical protein